MKDNFIRINNSLRKSKTNRKERENNLTQSRDDQSTYFPFTGSDSIEKARQLRGAEMSKELHSYLNF